MSEKDLGDSQYDGYYSRLIKLVPGEIAALYTWALAIFADSPIRLYFAASVCAALLIGIRIQATRGKNDDPAQWGGVVISLVSFGIWVAVLGGAIESEFGYQPRDAAFVMAAWTLVIPLIYKGDPE